MARSSRPLTPLRKERVRRSLTAQFVAQALRISQSKYTRIENGTRTPAPALADRIAKYFRNSVTRDQILFPADYAPKPRKKAA